MLLSLHLNLVAIEGGAVVEEDPVLTVRLRRARKANAGTYLLMTEEMRRDKRTLFKRFSVSR